MSARNRTRALAATAAVLGLMAAGAATADASPAVHSASIAPVHGGHFLGPGQTVHTTARLKNGKTVPVTISASKPVKVIGPKVAADVNCWREEGYITYGPGSDGAFSFHDDVNWCGDGSTISDPPVQQVYGHVNALGQIDQWQWDGIQGIPSSTKYYGGWAYQEFAAGKFEQCILKFGCDQLQANPTITWNVYADGTNQFFYDRGV